jgi:hypothetical protein
MTVTSLEYEDLTTDGGSDMGVGGTIFAEVMARIIFAIIVLIFIYGVITYLYDNYISAWVSEFKNSIAYIKNSINVITQIVAKLAGMSVDALKSLQNSPLGAAGSMMNPAGGLLNSSGANPMNVLNSVGGLFQ